MESAKNFINPSQTHYVKIFLLYEDLLNETQKNSSLGFSSSSASFSHSHHTLPAHKDAHAQELENKQIKRKNERENKITEVGEEKEPTIYAQISKEVITHEEKLEIIPFAPELTLEEEASKIFPINPIANRYNSAVLTSTGLDSHRRYTAPVLASTGLAFIDNRMPASFTDERLQREQQESLWETLRVIREEECHDYPQSDPTPTLAARAAALTRAAVARAALSALFYPAAYAARAANRSVEEVREQEAPVVAPARYHSPQAFTSTVAAPKMPLKEWSARERATLNQWLQNYRHLYAIKLVQQAHLKDAEGLYTEEKGQKLRLALYIVRDTRNRVAKALVTKARNLLKRAEKTGLLAKATSHKATENVGIFTSSDPIECATSAHLVKLFNANQRLCEGTIQIDGTTLDLKNLTKLGQKLSLSYTSGNHVPKRVKKPTSHVLVEAVEGHNLDRGLLLKAKDINALVVCDASSRWVEAAAQGDKSPEAQMMYRSNLHAILKPFEKASQRRRPHLPPMGGMLASGVTVFRDGESSGYAFTSQPAQIDIYTTALHQQPYVVGQKLSKIYQQRVQKRIHAIFEVAIQQGHTALVLAPWESMKDGYTPEEILGDFKLAIQRYGHHFDRIEFTETKTCSYQRICQALNRVLGKPLPRFSSAATSVAPAA